MFPTGTRILALDLHPQRYGYAVLETPAELLDWGVRRKYRKKGRQLRSPMQKSLKSLLDIWRPFLVVVTEPGRRTRRVEQRLAKLVEQVRGYHVPVQRITRQAVRDALGSGARVTNHSIASLATQRFPFLASMLYPPRRIWESAHYRTSMFAAIVLALAVNDLRRIAN